MQDCSSVTFCSQAAQNALNPTGIRRGYKNISLSREFCSRGTSLSRISTVISFLHNIFPTASFCFVPRSILCRDITRHSMQEQDIAMFQHWPSQWVGAYEETKQAGASVKTWQHSALNLSTYCVTTSRHTTLVESEAEAVSTKCNRLIYLRLSEACQCFF